MNHQALETGAEAEEEKKGTDDKGSKTATSRVIRVKEEEKEKECGRGEFPEVAGVASEGRIRSAEKKVTVDWRWRLPAQAAQSRPLGPCNNTCSSSAGNPPCNHRPI